MKEIRTDIQALRGIAVLFVVLAHIELGSFRQGFLGVDIFFVISGYLITCIIIKDLQAQVFSFKEFYFKRAKRILPSAYSTIFFVILLAPWFLNSAELSALHSQIIGALTFTINIVLYRQVGYFDVAAAFKPLLHLWSLAIEEQFYLFFPALLFFIPRRYWLISVTFLALISLSVCFYFAANHPSATFYLLPSRAWELLIGSLGFMLSEKIESIKFIKILLWPSLFMLFLLPLYSTGLPHPGIDALILCLSTIIIILNKNLSISSSLISRGLAKIGNISYSLYLVHWPIMVFMKSAYVTPIPLFSRIIAFILSLVLAFISNQVVENPLRRIKTYSLNFGISVCATPILILLVHLILGHYNKPSLDFAYLRRLNFGLSSTCDPYTKENHSFEALPECKTSLSPTTLVWGDSFAMHIIPGLVAHGNLKEGLIQATYSGCPPFLNSAPHNSQEDAVQFSKFCMHFNDDVRQYIQNNPAIKKVILSGFFAQYANPVGEMFLKTNKEKFSVVPRNLEQAKKDMGETIRVLQQMGKEVIIVSSPPSIKDENLACMERVLANKFVFGSKSSCEFDYQTHLQMNANVIALINYLEQTYKLKVIQLNEAICNRKTCHMIIDQVLIYRDIFHLSYAGAEKIFENPKINKLLG